jgi:benzoate-CoA ligase
VPRLNAATTLLASGLARHADKVAYVCEGESVTFRGLDELSSRFGSALLAAGASPGDRAVLVLPDGIAYVAAFLGCLKAGVWPALVSTSLDKESCEAILADSAARILIGDPSLAAWSAESSDLAFRLSRTPDSLRAFLASGDPGFLLYTSGTTGEPKGVIHAHGAPAITAEAFGDGVLSLTSDDVVFSASKLFFAYGLGNSLSFPLRAGATTILHPGKVTPGELVRILETHRPTVVFAVPSLYNLVLKFVEKVGPLAIPRLWVSAGEALSAPLVRAWMALTGAPVIDGIGTTEALHIFLSNRPDVVRPGSSGTPVPGYEVRLVDDEGRDVAAGTPGHLLVRGGSVAKGYWRRDGKSTAVTDAAGWLRTGDVYVDEDGVFFHRGRSDDLLKVDAQWVSPVVVEGVLYEHPSVAECAVTGVKVWGSVRVGAHVVLRDGVPGSGETVETLRQHVRTRLPAHMVPARITFCRELPKTATGKIQRFRLREGSG